VLFSFSPNVLDREKKKVEGKLILSPGAPHATILALFNPAIQVSVVDKSDSLIHRWNSRHIPLQDELGLHRLIRVTRDGTLPTRRRAREDVLAHSDDGARKPNLVFSTNVEACVREADMVFLCVETPTKTDGQGAGMAVDTASLEKAVRDIAKWAKDKVVVTVKSTVPFGMAGRIKEMVSSLNAGGAARPGLLEERH